MSCHRRLVSALLLLTLFALPLNAQTAPGREAEGFAFGAWLSALWETLSAPLTVLWEADETEGDPDGPQSPGGTTASGDGDEAGAWDPNGG